jgi:hypothetical protein
MVGSMSRGLAVVLVALASAVGTVVVAPPAAAAGLSPVQIQLTERGTLAACPGGTIVDFEPDPTGAPSFMLVNPGPAPCPAGIALVQNPDATGTSGGSAVALPLQASSCSTAESLFTHVADLLGAPGGLPGVAAPVSIDPTGVCPAADVAFAVLQNGLASVPVVPGSVGLVVQPRNGHEVIVAFLEGDPDKPIVIGSVFSTGIAPAGVLVVRELIVAFLDGDPDKPIVIGTATVPQVLVLVPSQTPGVSVISCRFC